MTAGIWRTAVTVAALGLLFPPWVCGFEVPRQALQLLAEARAETCPLCAEKERKEAFVLLDAALRPGVIVVPGGSCSFVKAEEQGFSISCPDAGDGGMSGRPHGDMPDVVFVFHTSLQRLVGIADKDLTEESLAMRFSRLRRGAPFVAKVSLVPFAYGDGTTFTYLSSQGRILVHCRILELGER